MCSEMANPHKSKAGLDEAFQTLELDCGATEEMVRQAYRELVKIWHPDRFENDAKLKARAQEKLKNINLAYELLIDHFNSTKPTAPGRYADNPMAQANTAWDTEKTYPRVLMISIIGLIAFLFFYKIASTPSKRAKNELTQYNNVAGSKEPQQSMVTSQVTPAVTAQQKTGKLSLEQKNEILRRMGYDPAKYEVGDDNYIYERDQQPPPQETFKSITIPKDVKFVIFVDRPNGSRDSYFSKKKPEPFGAGYKIYEYFTRSELVVNGQLTITPVNE